MSKQQIQPECGKGVGGRGTEQDCREPVSRDQIFMGERGKEETKTFQLTTSRINNLTRLIHTYYDVSEDHTYLHTDAPP